MLKSRTTTPEPQIAQIGANRLLPSLTMTPEDESHPLIEVRDLTISFPKRRQTVEAVRGIDFSLETGKTLAVVGESGSGKTITALSLAGLLLPPPECRVGGQILFRGRDVQQMKPRELRKLRGKEIAYIFQDPATSLNPVFSIGYQIAETIKTHLPEVKNVRECAIDSLAKVGIQEPQKRLRDFPHQLSGGQIQRVMIAMALACEPRLLIADEPTSALDATVQTQVLNLLRQIKATRSLSIILITHNFAIVAGLAQEVAVMFRGKIVESGPTPQILQNPQHPYTKALLACIPQPGQRISRLPTVDYSTLEC